MHGLFIQAIQQSLLQVICRQSKGIPLGDNKILAQSLWRQLDHDGDILQGLRDGFVVQLVADLTTWGSLILQLKPLPLCQQQLTLHAGNAIAGSTPLVCIAPNGNLAYLSHDTAKRQSSRPGERLNTVPRDWKSAVALWLQNRGITSAQLDADDDWILLEKQLYNVEDGEASNIRFWWPHRYCFALERQSSSIAVIPFDPNDEEELHANSLEFLSSWLAGREERQRQRATRTQSQLREDHLLQLEQTIEEPMADAFSPCIPLHQPPTDHHSVAGIYPTPPDGITMVMSQAGVGQSNTVEHQAAFSSPTAPSPLDCTSLDATDANASNSEGADTYSNEDNGDVNDDLFEDDDDLDDVGVTEADFRFFDEQDLERVDEKDILGSASVEAPNRWSRTSDEERNDEHQTVAGQLESALDEPMTQRESFENSLPEPNAESPGSDLGMEPIVESTSTMQSISTPPLSPQLVRKRLLYNTTQFKNPKEVSVTEVIRNNYLQPVLFDAVLSSSDLKYSRRGRFGDSSDVQKTIDQTRCTGTAAKAATIPLVGFSFFTHGKAKTHVRGLSDTLGNTEAEDILTSTGENSGDSGSEDTSVEADTPFPITGNQPTKRRKFDRVKGNASVASGSELVENDASPMSPWNLLHSLDVKDNTTTTPRTQTMFDEQERTFDRSIFHFEHTPADYIAMAQLVVENTTALSNNCSHHATQARDAIKLLDIFHLNAQNTSMLGTAERLDLTAFSQLRNTKEDAPTNKIQARPVPRRPVSSGHGRNTIVDESLYVLPAPRVSVTRAETRWELLPTALSFWNALGLGPASGAKHVHALCIYPENASRVMSENAAKFMNTMQNAYRQCKLGTHSDIDIENGALMPVQEHERLAGVCRSIGTLTPGRATHSLSLFSGRQITTIEVAPKTLIVYIVDELRDSGAIARICAAFLALVQTYKHHVASPKQALIDLVLQIVPSRQMDKYDSPLLLNPELAQTLAKEIYDRCPATEPTTNGRGLLRTAYCVELGEQTTNKLNFRLTDNPPEHLLLEGSRFHLAYCFSDDKEWLTVAWTDDVGKSSATSSYRLGGVHSLDDILTEVWQATLAIVRQIGISWRLFIVKVGFMDDDEIKGWSFRATSTVDVKLELHLFNVEPSPALSIAPILPSSQAATSSGTAVVAPAAYTTPVATPQSSTMSPAPTPPPTNTPGVPPSTPSADQATAPANDADVSGRLVDIVDETWALVLACRLNTARTSSDRRPALASGYLIKRTGADDLDPPALLEINLLHNGARAQSEGAAPADRQHNLLLREILVVYRGLGLLARVRGVEDRSQGVLPWHAAVAKRGADALARCMPPF